MLPKGLFRLACNASMGLHTEACCWGCRFGVVRKHAKVIAEDVKIARVFREHCVNAWDDDRNAWRSCFSDEHYFATVLATQGLDEVSPTLILDPTPEISRRPRPLTGFLPWPRPRALLCHGAGCAWPARHRTPSASPLEGKAVSWLFTSHIKQDCFHFMNRTLGRIIGADGPHAGSRCLAVPPFA